MAKFKLLAQFPVDDLAHPVVSSHILSLLSFTALAYYVTDVFIFLQHNLYLFFCVLFMLALTFLVLMVLFLDAIRGYSAFILSFPFISPV